MADATDANSPETTFLNALSASVDEAVSGGLPMRLALKGGEVLTGVPDSVKSDASSRPPSGGTPSELRHLYVDRVEVSVELGGTEVLLQEVASFTVTLPQ